MGDFVSVITEQAVATIHLNRPPLNVLNWQVQTELALAAAALRTEPGVRAVVLYGGERTFAAGVDVKEMSDKQFFEMLPICELMHSAFNAIASIPYPVIAAINGYALGGGLELALCADFRVCADDAKLGQPEILLGVIPGAGGTQRLPRLIGPARAKDLIYTGRFADAEEAYRIGLVDRVVKAQDVLPTAMDLARQFVNGAPHALRAAKDAIDVGLSSSIDVGLANERLQFAALFSTEDQTIGMTTFVNEGLGKAKFVGR